MSKIICDVCGTRYPESAEQCPICGRIHAGGATTAADTIVMDEAEEYSRPRTKGGRFSKSNVRKRNQNMPIFEEEEKPKARNYDPEEDEFEEEPPKDKGNTILNILLVIVIVALLAVTGYILVEYVLPNAPSTAETAAPTELETEAPTEAPTETEEPTIPCTELYLPETEVILTEEGQAWLMNVMVLPEDTTDILSYYSSDEAVVTVNDEGRIEAVGTGEAVVTAVCGEIQVECKVTCIFLSGDFPGDETEGMDATEGADAPESSDETEAPEVPEPTWGELKDVTLKVDLTDVTFTGKNQGYRFKVSGLDPTEVRWISSDESIVTIDEKGQAISVGGGRTTIIVQYGDQKVEIKVNCRF